jgi:hypothetical protein
MINNSIWGTMRWISFVVPFFIFAQAATYAQSRWSFELHGGEVYNVPMPLTISQDGYPDVKLTAQYDTEPFTLPFYWDMRLGRWQSNKIWEVEMIHHKLYLENTTPEIQKFNISHGFNLIMLNRGFDKKLFRYRFGAGMVLTHPESNIRGKVFGDSNDDKDLGYYLSGPALNLAVGKAFRMSSSFYLDIESKVTCAYTRVKVANGHADVYHLAFHLIFGVGIDFSKKG